MVMESVPKLSSSHTGSLANVSFVRGSATLWLYLETVDLIYNYVGIVAHPIPQAT